MNIIFSPWEMRNAMYIIRGMILLLIHSATSLLTALLDFILCLGWCGAKTVFASATNDVHQSFKRP